MHQAGIEPGTLRTGSEREATTPPSLPPSRLKSGSYLSNNLLGCGFNGTNEDEVYLKEMLSEIAYSSYFNFNMSRKSLLNIPREQHKALIGLSKNKEIIITGPYKSSGVVIMNKADYTKKMEEILGDSTKFKFSSGQDLYEVSRRIERRVRTNLLNLLRKPGYISDEDYKRLYPNGSHIGVLYGLPKVHKTNVPTRPIC